MDNRLPRLTQEDLAAAMKAVLTPRSDTLVQDCRVCGECHERGRRWKPSLCIAALRSHLGYLEARRGTMQRNENALADLRIIVRDQQTHIANLEAELRPHLLAPQPEQGALA